jgi:hypothetical protein
MKIATVAAAAALIAGGALVSGQAQAAKCGKYSTTAAMVGQPIAAEMAKMSLASALQSKGLKAKGKVAVKCKYEFILSSCTASQRACK